MHPKTAERLRGSLGFRRDRFRARFDDGDDGRDRGALGRLPARDAASSSPPSTPRCSTLRNEGVIDDNVMQRVQRDLDLEAARLDQ